MKKKRFLPFTLVELLMVCAIIVILVGISVGVFSVATRKASESKTEAILNKVCSALEAYKNKTGYYIQQATLGAFYVDNYQANADDFNDFIDIPNSELGGKKGVNTDRGALLDGFAREFRYRCPGTNNRGSFDLYSQGVDTTTTADDITNWK